MAREYRLSGFKFENIGLSDIRYVFCGKSVWLTRISKLAFSFLIAHSIFNIIRNELNISRVVFYGEHEYIIYNMG